MNLVNEERKNLQYINCSNLWVEESDNKQKDLTAGKSFFYK